MADFLLYKYSQQHEKILVPGAPIERVETGVESNKILNCFMYLFIFIVNVSD